MAEMIRTHHMHKFPVLTHTHVLYLHTRTVLTQAGAQGAVVTGYENIMDVWTASFTSIGPIPLLAMKDIHLNFQVFSVI